MSAKDCTTCAMAVVPDYEKYFLKDRFSDVTLVIQDETEALGKRKRDKAIPAHSMVLMAFSKYFETKLHSWSEATAASSDHSTAPRFEIHLPVPAGQQDLAELLIKGIYQKQPSITADFSHAQLLQLLLLADRFEVPKVQAAVLQALSQVPAEQLQWQTALDILDLPAVCAEQPKQFKAVQDLALKRLLHELGDLEAAWGSEQKQQLLLGLPFAALKQLLQHPDTRVASENTVVYTIEQWYKQQPTAQQRTLQQLQELMRLARLPHCSAYFLGTSMVQSKLVIQCFSHLELAAAQLLCSDTTALAVFRHGNGPLLDRFPAWTAGKRPASTRQQAIVWHLPLSELQSAVEEVLGEPAAAPKIVGIDSSSHVLQGQQLEVTAEVKVEDSVPSSSSDGASRQLVFGLFIQCQQLPSNAVLKSSARFTMYTVKAAAATHAAWQRSTGDIVQVLPVSGFSANHQAWGFPDMITLGELSSWEAVEKVLRAKQLVHPAGHEAQAEPHLSIRVDILELQ